MHKLYDIVVNVDGAKRKWRIEASAITVACIRVEEIYKLDHITKIEILSVKLVGGSNG